MVAIGAEEQCGLCGHLGAVQNAVATSPISASDEEEAMALLMEVYALLRKQRGSADAAVRDGVGMTHGEVGSGVSSDAPPYRAPLPQPVLRWKRGVLSDDPSDDPPAR